MDWPFDNIIDNDCRPISCVDETINGKPYPLLDQKNLSDLENPHVALTNLGVGEAGRSLFAMGTRQEVIDYLDLPPPPPPATAAETYVNIKNYGGGNGVDDDAALAETILAENPNCSLFHPHSQYRWDTCLDVPYGNAYRIKGESREGTVFNLYNNGTGISFAGNGVAGVGCEDFRINGIGQKTQGYGIDIPNIVNNSYVKNVIVEGVWIGFGLGPTDCSYIENCISRLNWSHGQHVRNKNGLVASTLQWVQTNNLSEMNNGSGYIYEGVAAAGQSQAPTGTLTGCMAFANGRYGMEFLGKSNLRLQGVRLSNCFVGQDNLGGVMLDTYGSQHTIQGGFYELSGSMASGRSLLIPKSNFGVGIQFTGNNGISNITGSHIGGNGLDGVLTEAEHLTITGATIINNGLNSVAGRRNGIYHLGANLNVTGGMSQNVQNGTLQQYGITSTNGQNLRMTGVEMDGNAIGKFNVVNPDWSRIVNC